MTQNNPPTPAPSPSVEEARGTLEEIELYDDNAVARRDLAWRIDALIAAARAEGRRELAAELLNWAATIPANMHLDLAKELRRRIGSVDVQPEQARGCATKVI